MWPLGVTGSCHEGKERKVDVLRRKRSDQRRRVRVFCAMRVHVCVCVCVCMSAVFLHACMGVCICACMGMQSIIACVYCICLHVCVHYTSQE